jgi:hypothetical protein
MCCREDSAVEFGRPSFVMRCNLSIRQTQNLVTTTRIFLGMPYRRRGVALHANEPGESPRKTAPTAGISDPSEVCPAPQLQPGAMAQFATGVSEYGIADSSCCWALDMQAMITDYAWGPVCDAGQHERCNCDSSIYSCLSRIMCRIAKKDSSHDCHNRQHLDRTSCGLRRA